MALHLESPLLESRPIGLAAGRQVRLKIESLQPSRSFKMRGIGHACEAYQRRGARRFVCSSGGNAGLAAACAGRILGVPVVVVVPETATARAIALLRAEMAEVIVHGASWQEANGMALDMLRPADAFIHPFDDPLAWQGHATLIEEVARSGYRPEAIVLSVGGGGLLCGVMEGLQQRDWLDIPVIAVETEGAASLNAAVKSGHSVELERISSVATSLGARRVCDRALHWAQAAPVDSVVVSDRAALLACERFLDDHGILVEPACGASLAVVYDRLAAIERFDDVLVIVCGGATATLDQIRTWLAANPG